MITREFIENLIKNKHIDELIKLTSSIKLNPICIPSYKFRKESDLIRNIPFISKVYLFLYDDDYVESGYDKYPFPENVEIIKITKEDFEKNGLEWRGIQPKRVFIQRFMKNKNIDKYFMLDDDIKLIGKYSKTPRNNKCGSCYLEKIKIEDILKILQFIGELYPEYQIIGTHNAGMETQFFKFDTVISDKVVAGLYYLNSPSIEFSKSTNIAEDHDLYIRCFLNGIKTGILPFISFYCQSIFSASTLDHTKLAISDYLNYPQYYNLKISKTGGLYTKINYRKLKTNNNDIDLDLVKYCKENNIEAIKAHLKK